MNRRSFIQKISKQTLSVAALLALSGWAKVFPGSRKSKNWIWITPDLNASDDDWKRRFEKLKQSGFDAVIPEVYNGGPAFYGSGHLPVQAEYLERLIPIAKSFGLEIHAWMWTMPCLLESVQKNRPDWYMVNRLGESAVDKPAYVDYYKFLCPAKEEVQDFIQTTVRELAQFDVDGIHLDYVRYPDVILAKGLWEKYGIVQDKEYPEYDYCYCDTCRTKFKEMTGIDPLKIKDPSTHQSWLQFRYDQVTHLVNEKAVPVAHKFGKKISAAVFPNWRNVRQQWPQWKLDAVMPMLYNNFYLANAEWIKQYSKEGIKSLKYDSSFYSGLFLDEPEKFREYIIKSFEGGAEGVSVFSLGGLTDQHLAVLTETLAKY